MLNQVHPSSFGTRKLLNGLVFQFKASYFYHKKVNVTWKRGSILSNMFVDRDKKKDWHFKIMTNQSPKSKSVFEKVHKPFKRQHVLNSLFIKNITDVLSTGDVAPEVMGKGVEITGVKISPCCRILNVFWQISPHHYDSSEEIQNMFERKASSIRSELISRNVLGRVPKIFFIRDSTNARAAAFEEAIRKADFGSEKDSPIIPDDEFIKNIFSFKPPKVTEKAVHVPETINKNPGLSPPKPADMKSDILGLNHEILMNKVITLKKQCSLNEEEKPAVFPEGCSENSDLFSKIPGTVFQRSADREKILKQFQIQRKMLLKKDHQYENNEYIINNTEQNDFEQLDEYFLDDADKDFIEEDTTERF